MLAAWFAIALSSAAPSLVSEQRLSLDVKDAQVTNVLRLLADQAHVNLVVSERVTGRITLKLQRVAWQDALDAILQHKDLAIEKNGNVWLIDTAEAVEARVKSKAARAEAAEKSGTLRTVLIPVNHARAEDLQVLVRPLLTSRGTISVDARTNTLIVTDVDTATRRVGQTLGR
ncbi:MAG: pilus assembly protein PilQ [Deltaproteobacteria bacterium]|nr:pilus assembly protein PilQ [Deltaproteobacteria bacterium]